jgi:hypothetical protein
MAAVITLEDLARRLTTLEQEVALLRQRWERGNGVETPLERGLRLMREADANQAALSAGWAEALGQMGIQGEPIGAEKVQQLIAAGGANPEDAAFSREIIAMREE